MDTESQVTAQASAEMFRQLMQAQMTQFNATREIQFKVTLAVWTFLAAAAYAGLSFSKKTPGATDAVVHLGPVVHICALAIVLLYFCWMTLIQQSLNYDKTLWIKYRELTMAHLGIAKGDQPSGYDETPLEALPVPAWLRGFGDFARKHLGRWIWVDRMIGASQHRLRKGSWVLIHTGVTAVLAFMAASTLR